MSGSIKSVASDPRGRISDEEIALAGVSQRMSVHLEEKGNAFLLTVHAAFTQVAECRRASTCDNGTIHKT